MSLEHDLSNIRQERATRVREISIDSSRFHPGEPVFDVRFQESANFGTVITINAKEARAWGEALIALAKEHDE